MDEIRHRVVTEDEDAYHDGNVVITEYGEGQADHVQHRAPAVYDPVESHDHQRKKEHRIQPHDAPEVAHHVCAECIKGSECRSPQIACFVGFSQIDGHEGSRKTDLDEEYRRDTLHESRCREEDQYQIQRACPVIGDKVPEIAPRSAVPGVQKRICRLELMLQLTQKRHILVIHIDHRYLL